MRELIFLLTIAVVKGTPVGNLTMEEEVDLCPDKVEGTTSDGAGSVVDDDGNDTGIDIDDLFTTVAGGDNTPHLTTTATQGKQSTKEHCVNVTFYIHSYYERNNWRNWTSARDFCRSRGERLWSPLTKEEIYAVAEISERNGVKIDSVWVDWNDIEEQGTFVDSMGETLPVVDWYDFSIPDEELLQQGIWQTGEPSMHQFRFYDRTMSWEEAKQFCADKGMNLWSPRTQKDMNTAFVGNEKFEKKSFWLGWNDLEEEGVFKDNATGDVFPEDSDIPFGKDTDFWGASDCSKWDGYYEDVYLNLGCDSWFAEVDSLACAGQGDCVRPEVTNMVTVEEKPTGQKSTQASTEASNTEPEIEGS